MVLVMGLWWVFILVFGDGWEEGYFVVIDDFGVGFGYFMVVGYV